MKVLRERNDSFPEPSRKVNAWPMPMVYTVRMAKTAKTNAQDGTRSKVAKLFRNGRSQAVRLPKEFRFEGDRVLVRKVKEGVLLEPIASDVREWFARMDRLRAGGLFPARAKQKKPPIRRYFD